MEVKLIDNQKNLSIYLAELESWRQSLDESLKKEDSWLALAGLYWLEEGENTFGTGTGNNFVLDVSSGPERIGSFTLENGEVFLRVSENQNVLIDGGKKEQATLKADSSGSPTEIKLDHLTFMLLNREDGMAIRLWDNQRPERKKFQGRQWFDIDKEFVIRGTYHPFDSDQSLVMSRKNGSDYQTSVDGEVSFMLGDMEYGLLAFLQENGALFTLFLDQTSGNKTYPAGRYLVIEPPQDNQVEIDFNRAYHPPCAFTNYATCPLPPAQNRLELEILAGERL